jgi:hypothetical protein
MNTRFYIGSVYQHRSHVAGLPLHPAVAPADFFRRVAKKEGEGGEPGVPGSPALPPLPGRAAWISRGWAKAHPGVGVRIKGDGLRLC